MCVTVFAFFTYLLTDRGINVCSVFIIAVHTPRLCDGFGGPASQHGGIVELSEGS